MDAGNRDELKTDKGSEDCMITFANLLMEMAPEAEADLVCASSFVPIADSFVSAPALWDHHPAGIQHGIAEFPADSAFIERAARFACFSPAMNQPIHPYHQAIMMPQDHQKSELNPASADLRRREESPKKPVEMKNGASTKNITKRKRGAQEPITEDVKDNGKPNSEAPNNGGNGKKIAQTSVPPKEEYVHVRARRGQATSSHSLAERARREKINERMKFLQDLVPGCSKVTAKAVMLEQIINYIQSLQRQVEFLSMKIATMNSRLDFDMESFLAKVNMFAARSGPATMGLSTDIPVGYQQLHPSQPTVINPNHRSQLTGTSQGYKDPTSQVQNLWDNELHKASQMVLSSDSSPENQDTNSVPAAKAKVEL